MNPIDFACYYQHPTELWTCGAQAGEPCTCVTSLCTRMKLKWMHAERKEAANAMLSSTNEIPDVKEFDKVAEELL